MFLQLNTVWVMLNNKWSAAHCSVMAEEFKMSGKPCTKIDVSRKTSLSSSTSICTGAPVKFVCALF